MRVAVVGGKLQGLEAAYLAKKAGWHVLLIDKEPQVPARGICDRFYCLNVNETEKTTRALEGIDFIIPALENRECLSILAETAEKTKTPIALDLQAYTVSSSKTVSDRLFMEIGLPVPALWPECGFPVIAKPDNSSGSAGIARIQNEIELRALKEKTGPGAERWVIQEYLEGPSYSIEVIGYEHEYSAFQVTELEMDPGYDCKRVIAPANLSIVQQKQLERIALTIAGALKLKGIMDVEVILHDHKLKVLEIDARLPSQTPTVVYHSTGVNLLEVLADCFVRGTRPGNLFNKKQQAVIYEHIKVSPEKLEVSGEHIISPAGPLSFHEGFFGAEEALTNYCPGKKHWAATLIVTAKDREQAKKKMEAVVDNIRKKKNLDYCFDSSPAAVKAPLLCHPEGSARRIYI